MSEKLDCIAIHEAGHAVAHILAGITFEYLTIKEEEEKDEFGYRSLGHVVNENTMTPEECCKGTKYQPDYSILLFIFLLES